MFGSIVNLLSTVLIALVCFHASIETSDDTFFYFGLGFVCLSIAIWKLGISKAIDKKKKSARRYVKKFPRFLA